MSLTDSCDCPVDLPLIRGDESETAGYVAATQSPWPGGVAFYASPETTDFRLAALASAPATTGQLLDALVPGPAGRLDKASRVRVKIDRGELSSASQTAMLAGANLAAVRNANGGWELIQFQNAVLTAPATYELSAMLRALSGTDPEMSPGAPAGSRFVLIDATVPPVALNAAEVGLPLVWRYGPADRDFGEESYAGATHTFAGLARRPLSPVHLRGKRDSGDLTITWIRRTRSGGDSWETLDVPLAEESERYEIDILDGVNVIRTIPTDTPSAVYAQAQQIADFGAAPSSITLRVSQISAAWGRGPATEATI